MSDTVLGTGNPLVCKIRLTPCFPSEMFQGRTIDGVITGIKVEAQQCEGYKGEGCGSQSIYVTGRFHLLEEGTDDSKGK